MKRWFQLTPSSVVLLCCSIGFSFCCFWDPGSLRISFLGIPLLYYGTVLGVAAMLILGPPSTKFLGFLAGGVAFSTFLIGLLYNVSWDSRAEVEASVASVSLYGTIAAFYWIQAWRRVFEVEEVSGNGMRNGEAGSEAQ